MQKVNEKKCFTRKYESVSRNSLLLVVSANDENDVRESGVVEEEGEPVLDGHLRRLPVVEAQVAVLVSLRRMVPLGWLRR